MAEKWSTAFGRYLRMLRQRRGLSLQEVCSLSQVFAETLDKGYLSRCENGHQGPALSKIIPLSRIYDVPADVLLERLELDMELDRIGGPETAGLTFGELTDRCYTSINEGYVWTAYAFARDAISRAATDRLMARYTSKDEQRMGALMNCASTAGFLGREMFALHEYQHVEQSRLVGPALYPIVLERLSQSFRKLKQFDRALHYGDLAVAEAEQIEGFDRLGHVYTSRALLALAMGDLRGATEYFGQAYAAHKKAGRQYECARALNNLAQVYFSGGRLRAARRALAASERLAEPIKQHRALALGRILLGVIESLEHHDELATLRWREAARIARQLDDKVLRFKAEYYLFRQAHQRGDQPVARALHRRLRKLSHWVPDETPELADFNVLATNWVSVPIN